MRHLVQRFKGSLKLIRKFLEFANSAQAVDDVRSKPGTFANIAAQWMAQIVVFLNLTDDILGSLNDLISLRIASKPTFKPQ